MSDQDKPTGSAAPGAAPDISDLPLERPGASEAEGDEAQPQLPEDVQREVERCKAWQVRRNADKPGAPPPLAFYVVACGEHMVFSQPSLDGFERLLKMSTNDAQKHRSGRQLVMDTLFWIRGQKGKGPDGAVERIKEVANYGGIKVLLLEKAAGAILDHLNAAAGDDVVKKL